MHRQFGKGIVCMMSSDEVGDAAQRHPIYSVVMTSQMQSVPSEAEEHKNAE